MLHLLFSKYSFLDFTITCLEPFDIYGHTDNVLAFHYYHSDALGYTVLLVFPSGTYMYKCLGVLTLQHATYSWLCENQAFCKLIPATLRNCPSALFIIIKNASLMGDFSRLKSKGISLNINGIRGRKTCLLYTSRCV